MSDPFTSAYPTPVATSDPAVSSGKTNVVRFSERVRDWIKGLSPTGVTVYDTGWVACTIASGFSGTAQARRIGRAVFLQGALTLASSITGNASTPAATLPAGLMPTVTQGFPALWTNGEYNWGSINSTTGVVTVRKTTTGVSTLYFNASFAL